MATIGMGDMKKGTRLEITGNPFRVTEFQHVKPGKGAAFVRMKIKNLETGKVIDKTVHAGDKFEVPELEQKTMQYLSMMMERCCSSWIQQHLIRSD